MERISKQGLIDYLSARGNPYVSFVYWNNEPLSVDEALRRAHRLSEGAQLAKFSRYIYSSPACSGWAPIPLSGSALSPEAPPV